MQIAPVEGHGGQRLAVQLGSYQRVHLGHVAAQPQQPGHHMRVVGHVMVIWSMPKKAYTIGTWVA